MRLRNLEECFEFFFDLIFCANEKFLDTKRNHRVLEESRKKDSLLELGGITTAAQKDGKTCKKFRQSRGKKE